MLFLTHSGYGYSRKLCKNISHWFLEKFLPRHKIYLDVHHRGLKREDAFGYCDYCDYPSRPRDFTIELHANMSKELYTKTLLHELVHLRQWVEGSLRYKKGQMMYKNITVSKMDYMEQPHEIEAYELEDDLYLAYVYDTTGNWIGDS